MARQGTTRTLPTSGFLTTGGGWTSNSECYDR
jgi:hypothetical protein